MSNRQQIEDALKRLIFDDDREFVTMLSGEWGIGKTYFWDQFKKENLKDKHVVYVSLFGKNSLKDIETSIILELSKYAKNTKRFQKHLDKIGEWGSKALGMPFDVSIGSLLSLFTPTDFKNIIISFDDFERLSYKVPIKDVMGLISQFKEQKKCKIVMIFNEGELSKSHQKIFTKNKEKIVDYTFYYQPSQKELFEAIEEGVTKVTICDKETIYNFFRKIELKNIRIMKQALSQLKHFNFIKDQSFDKRVINEFVEIALNLFVFKAKSNYIYKEFSDMQDYLSSTISNENKKKDNPHEENKLHYHDLPYFYSKEELETIIYTYIDSHIIAQDKLLNLLQEYNSYVNKDDIRDEIFNLYNKARFDFSSNLSEIAKEIFVLLEGNKVAIPYRFEPINFEQYLNFITEHNNSLISQGFRDDFIKLYIDFQPNMQGYLNYKHFVKDYYPHLVQYIDDAIQEETRRLININDLQVRLKKFSSHTSYNNQDIQLLNSLSASIYKQHIQESEEFYNEVTAFLSADTPNELKQTNLNIKQALRELKNENGDNDWRITQLLKETNIKLENEK